jgi:5'-3' exonuclease
VDRDEAGVVARFGVGPASIPDWLALVGDTADGIPGIPGWGEKSAGAVLARYGTIDSVPDDSARWDVSVRGRERLAAALRGRREEAALYRRLATLRTDVPLAEGLHELEWRGARRADLERLCAEIGWEAPLQRVPRWRE